MCLLLLNLDFILMGNTCNYDLSIMYYYVMKRYIYKIEQPYLEIWCFKGKMVVFNLHLEAALVVDFQKEQTPVDLSLELNP